MDVRALRYFVAAYEEKSLSAAAKRSFVAQPSISAAIAELEDRLGVALFVRHARGVTPTAEGEALYDAAIKVIGDMTAIERMFAAPDTAAPPLALAVMPSIDAARLTDVLKALVGDGGDGLRLVELGDDCDARLVSERMAGGAEAFAPLWTDRYVLALPRGHALSLKRTVSLSDLDGLAFVERCSCEALGEVMAALERHKVRPRVVAQAKTEDWASAMVASGLGCALLPEEEARRHADIVTRDIDGLSLTRVVGLAHPTDRPLPKRLREGLARLRGAPHRPARRRLPPAA